MIEHRGLRFESQEIHLTGDAWINCTFIDCELWLYKDGAPTLLKGGSMDGCTLNGDWPEEVYQACDRPGVTFRLNPPKH